jgi:hypothetical protein
MPLAQLNGPLSALLRSALDFGHDVSSVYVLLTRRA